MLEIAIDITSCFLKMMKVVRLNQLQEGKSYLYSIHHLATNSYPFQGRQPRRLWALHMRHGTISGKH